MIRISLFALLLLGLSPVHADIYKCMDPEGNVAYQQTPCPVEKKEAPVDQAEAEESDEVEPPAIDNRSHEDVEECKDPLRDAIDDIDAEMLRGYTAAQGEGFKVKLRTLTQEMRACG
jgi:hypothetical protein